MKKLVRLLLDTPRVWHDAFRQYEMTALYLVIVTPPISYLLLLLSGNFSGQEKVILTIFYILILLVLLVLIGGITYQLEIAINSDRLSWDEAWDEVDASEKEKLVCLRADEHDYWFSISNLVGISNVKSVKICDKGIYNINGEIIPVLLCPLRDATTDDIAYIMYHYRYPDDTWFLLNLMTVYPNAIDTLRSKYPDTTEKIKKEIMEFGVNKYTMPVEIFKKLFDKKFWPIYGESKYTPLEIAKAMYLWCLEVHDNEHAIKWSKKFNQLKETEDGIASKQA